MFFFDAGEVEDVGTGLAIVLYVFECFIDSVVDVFFPAQEFLSEVFPLLWVHEGFVLGGLVSLWEGYFRVVHNGVWAVTLCFNKHKWA